VAAGFPLNRHSERIPRCLQQGASNKKVIFEKNSFFNPHISSVTSWIERNASRMPAF
jgi:hypothetical protein